MNNQEKFDKYKELYQAGIISREELNAKAEILSIHSNPAPASDVTVAPTFPDGQADHDWHPIDDFLPTEGHHQPPRETYAINAGNPGNTAEEKKKNGSVFWSILAFCLPLIGFILFLVFRGDKPKSSMSSLIGAIIGVVAALLFSFLTL